MEDKNMYDVNQYSDQELYNILDLINPSDRELEAKIFFLIHKYENMQNKSGDELANFFRNIYNHFFETSDDEEYEEYAIEGMENAGENIKTNEDYTLYDYSGKNDPNSIVINGNQQLYADMDKGNVARTLAQWEKIRGNNDLTGLKVYNPPTGNPMNIISSQLSDISKNMGMILDKSSEYRKNDIGFTKPIDYAQDRLNPLLKQTIKRIISIDSQYRDDKTTLSTEFSFNLSEPLRDVVSLKLYSIQIPYTWYTINNNFGSNFIYIKGNSPGIEDVSYQIDISAGNYSPINLIDTINTSIQKVKLNNPDVSFGNTFISYNPNNCLSTINVDITNKYNETNYYVEFGNWTNPNYGNIILREQSIPSFLGFNYKTYYPNVLYSKYLPLSTNTTTQDNEALSYYIYTQDTIDGSRNNYFNIIKYIGDISYSSTLNGNIITEYNSATSNIDSTYEIKLSLSGLVTRNQIIEDLSNQLANNIYLTNSTITRNNIEITIQPPLMGNGYSKFALSLKLNRFTTNNIENSKLVVKFPNENNTKNLYNIWSGASSCFNFPAITNEMNNIFAETEPLKQSGEIITVKSNPYIYLSSGERGYDVSTNDYIIPIANSPVGYSVNDFINAINDGINNVTDIFGHSKINDFNITNSKSYIDNNSVFNLQLDINKIFSNDNYYLDTSGILYNVLGLTGEYLSNQTDLSSGYGYVFGRQFPQSGTYITDNSCILTVYPSNKKYGNEKGGDYKVYLSSTSSYLKNGIYTYNSLASLQSDINNAFSNLNNNIINPNDVNTNILNGTNISLSINKNNSNFIDCSFTISIRKVLTQKYYRIQFCDISANSNLPIPNPLIKGNIIVASNQNGNLILTNGNLTSTNGILTNYTNGSWSKLAIDEKYCGLNSFFYDLSNSPVINTYTKLICSNSITFQQISFTGDNSDNIITFKPYDKGVITTNHQNDINIIITAKTSDNATIIYSRDNLIAEINNQLSLNPLTNGSYIQIINNIDNSETTKLRININKVYTTKDYRLVFYDQTSFVKCSSGIKSVRNTTWDTTLGWILGFRDSTIYNLMDYINTNNNSNIISLTGDTTVSVNLFNYFLICLDDFNQNHLNDGLVTLTPKITEIPLPSYANRNNYVCDPVTGMLSYNTNETVNYSKLTQNQIYSLTEIANSKRSSSIISSSANVTSKGYGSGPFVKDVFGLIPMKTTGLANGSVYVEFGGTLQNQERTYFGPVNIHRMAIKLVSDRGDVVDLNGSNWSFSLICEQIYQQKPTNGST